MTLPSGVTSESQAHDDLIAGAVEILPILVDSTATVAKGQVFEYDATGHNSVNKTTAGVSKGPYAVCTETRTIAGDSRVSCIVAGKVRFDALDATSKADADIKAALRSSGIFAIESGLV